MFVEPYLNFDGRCEEALEFYKHALGAKVTALMRMNQSPEPAPPGTLPPGSENKVMHSYFHIGESTLMASDCQGKGAPKFDGFSLTITVKSATEVDPLFNALCDGGQIQMPLGPTFYSPRCGCVTDRFGVMWMIVFIETS